MVNIDAIRDVAARDCKAYIECRTEHEARIVCRVLYDLGYEWSGGESLREETYFGVYGDGTRYFLHSNRRVMFGPTTYIDDTFEAVSAFLPDEDDDTDYETAGLISWIQSVNGV